MPKAKAPGLKATSATWQASQLQARTLKYGNVTTKATTITPAMAARRTSANSYRFRTMRPMAYAGRTPHIHVKVKLGQRELLTTQLYVVGDAGNARDFLWRNLNDADRAALTVPFVQSSDGLKARFPIAVAV